MGERIVVTCPICEGIIEIDAPQPGMLVDCPDCGEAYRIASRAPLQLVYAFDSEEEGSFPDENYPRAGSAGSSGSEQGSEP